MDPLRVMTYNVRYDADEDGPDRWANRKDEVAETIAAYDPDLIGLQEPYRRQLADLEAELDQYEWVGQARRPAASEGEYTPVGYRTDRFDRLDAGTFWLSETPQEPGSSGWDGKYPRVVSWVQLSAAGGDQPLLCVNTHLDHEGPRARRESASLIAGWLAERAGGTRPILTGDFNCTPGSAPYTTLDGSSMPGGRRLVDTAALAETVSGPETTRTDFHALVSDRRIDHVFVGSDWRVPRHETVTDRTDERYPSDHLPVVVDLA
jgi:endonuclease/exonuclease/phosphatase family metal-dependent hydrolase